MELHGDGEGDQSLVASDVHALLPLEPLGAKVRDAVVLQRLAHAVAIVSMIVAVSTWEGGLYRGYIGVI